MLHKPVSNSNTCTLLTQDISHTIAECGTEIIVEHIMKHYTNVLFTTHTCTISFRVTASIVEGYVLQC